MGGSRKILKEFFGWMLFLWLLWFWSGGPLRIEQIDQPFLKPPSPLNSGEDFGQMSNSATISFSGFKKNIDIRSNNQSDSNESNKDSSDNVSNPDSNESQNSKKSQYLGMINIYVAKGYDGNPDFLEIVALKTNKKPINITGWEIKSSTSRFSGKISLGAETIYQGKISEESDIFLYPGEKALILPNSSPVGISFKMNKCIGYLEQFQEFYPHLPKYCPHPGFDEPQIEDGGCKAFAKTINRCNAFINDFPEDLSDTCKKTISKRLSYNSCVSEHIEENDFYKKEWRVYLGEKENAFGSKNGDFIRIYDAGGHLIESIFYNK